VGGPGSLAARTQHILGVCRFRLPPAEQQYILRAVLKQAALLPPSETETKKRLPFISMSFIFSYEPVQKWPIK